MNNHDMQEILFLTAFVIAEIVAIVAMLHFLF
nr:MAG TPA: hypothetical protein [Caudoviricetes sp.]